MLVLPKDNINIEILYIPLKKTIIKEQIELITSDTSLLDSSSFNVNDKTIEITLDSLSVDFLTGEINEYIIIITDRAQDTPLIYTINLLSPPTFTIPQTLFIKDSSTKELTISVTDLGTEPDILTIINIYEYIAVSSYLQSFINWI